MTYTESQKSIPYSGAPQESPKFIGDMTNEEIMESLDQAIKEDLDVSINFIINWAGFTPDLWYMVMEKYPEYCL